MTAPKMITPNLTAPNHEILLMAPDLELPLETTTQAIAILAQRRQGKSYTARRLVEQLHFARQQVVIIDPKGDWWGIRASADGNGPGLPILIIGGERGDVPLEPGAGEVVAKLIVEERVSALLDLSLLRKHEVATFMAAFLEALYRLKAREKYRTAMMLVIDEADAIAPQKPQPNEARMLGAADDIVRRGGQRGIGCTMISQRAAVLNKNVLSQIGLLVLLRTIGPQDLDAVNTWIDVHGTPERRKWLMQSLPTLGAPADPKSKDPEKRKDYKGEAWWWAPGWPTADGIFLRTRCLPIKTFDSGATPKPGEERLEPRELAEVDLDALRRQMADTIERAKADDPKALRAKIAELEQRLAERAREADTPLIAPAEIARLTREIDRLVTHLDQTQGAIVGALVEVGPVRDALRAIGKLPQPGSAPASARGSAMGGSVVRKIPDHMTRPRAPAAADKAPQGKAAASGERVPSGARAMLQALKMLGGSGSRGQIAMLAGIRPKGSTMRNNLALLKHRELVDPEEGDRFSLTPAGAAEAGDLLAPPTVSGIVAMWRRNLPEGAGRLLEYLVERGGADREQAAAALEVDPRGSTLRNHLGVLRRCGLVLKGEPLRVSDTLFVGAAS